MSEPEIVLLDPRASMREICTIWPGECVCEPGSIEETRTYIFELRNSPNPLKAHIFIDDQRLRRDILDDPLRVQWEWTVEFHAGEVEIMIHPGSPEQTIRKTLITDPDRRKLTRAQFDLMVRQILDDTFSLLSLSSYKFQIARGNTAHVPPIARLEFLRSQIDKLELVVQEINSNPVRVLRSTMEKVPYHKVTHLTSPELMKSFAHGKILMGSGTHDRLPQALGGKLPEKIYKTQKSAGLDIREHRDIKATLKLWSSWLLSIADLLEQRKTEDRDLSAQKIKWATRCRTMSRRLRSLLKLPLFAEVQDVKQPVYSTQIYQRIPTYGKFLTIYNDFQRGIANIAGDFLQVPLARTYDLYEIWVFLRLARAASMIYSDSKFNPDEIFTTDGRTISVSPGPICLLFGDQLHLCFQRTYREFWIERDGKGTYSRYMRPDYTVELPEQEDKRKLLIVFDAKYRVETGLNDALSSIHTYKDALVYEEKVNTIKRFVAGAYIITPDIYDTDKDWKNLRIPARLFHPEYRSKFLFGAITMSPGIQNEEVITLLKTIIADCSQ